MKKFWKGLITFGLIAAMCVPFAACGKENTEKTGQEKVYEAYVAYAEAAGEEVLSYEDWLETVRGPQGEKGEKGDKGDTGAQGLKGDKGDTGATGAQGLKGDKGDTGAQGLKGDKGDTGATGAQGEKGDKGDTGAQGAQGDKGDTGATGAQGLKGDKGETGATGAQGEKGDKGETGAQGAQGDKGDKGDKGDTGAQGLKGDKGDKGETGATGAQGEKGDKGDKGDTGATGATGRIGFIVRTVEELNAALSVDNAYVLLLNDITDYTSNGGQLVSIKGTKNVVLDLGGHTLEGKWVINVLNGADAIVKNGKIVSNNEAVFVGDDSSLVADGLTVNATEACFVVVRSSELTVNGGTYTSADNSVIMTNGTVKPDNDCGHNTIVVNGGTFNGGIKSEGFIACGIYVANSDAVTVNGGTFNIENGVGIMARSGNTVVGDGVVFNMASTEGGIAAGWVGDKKVYVPAGKEIVLDTISEYPGGAPSVTAESHTVFTLEKTSADSEDALRAAIENGTYVVLSRDIDLARRIDVTKNLTIDLGGHKVTMSAGNTTGQAFNVIGANVVIENGSIDGTALTQTAGSSVKGECDPVIARNGAVVTLKNLNVTIDSITGACAYAFTGSRINVVSGTYVNNTTEDYPYAPSVKALTLNQANESNRLVFVTGGTFKGNSPTNGDDSGKVATFVADGYKTVENADGSVKVVKA